MPRLIQGNKNIFMRASGHWATALFAIFFALYDSIQASRLILRAPTGSASIRNICIIQNPVFFSFLFFKHSYYFYTPIHYQATGVVRGRLLVLVYCWRYLFRLMPSECRKPNSHVVLHAETLTGCHMVRRCQLNNHQHRSCLAIVDRSFLMATEGQILTE